MRQFKSRCSVSLACGSCFFPAPAPLVAASTASITAARKPARSSACSPAMVVPPGLATASFSAPGCCPVSSTIFAAPSTVWAASASATSRGRPHFTPPSASASMNTYTNAGPLPLRPVTASSSVLRTRERLADRAEEPADQCRHRPPWRSCRVRRPMRSPRPGTACSASRGRAASSRPALRASVWSVTPAAIETTRCRGPQHRAQIRRARPASPAA